MPKFYHVFLLDTLCWAAILGTCAYLFSGFFAASYILISAAPFIAYQATAQTRRNIIASCKSYRRITAIFRHYREESLLEELNALAFELDNQQKAVIITATASADLRKLFKGLEDKAIAFAKNVQQAEAKARTRYAEEQRQARERQRHYQQGQFDIEPIPHLEEAVAEILEIKALQKLRFKYASPQKRKDIIENFCKASAARFKISETTLLNHVMGRLSRQSRRKAV